MSSPAKAPRTQLRVGRLVKAHGLKGALKVELYTDDPARRFVPGATFALQVPTSSPWHGRSIELTELRWYNAHPVAFFEGVGDRTAAETLVKAILWVDQDPAEPAEDDAWFDFQLVGLAALRDGEQVGRVARVDHMPAQDLLAIDTGDGEVLVPFVKAIVPAVDIEAGTLTLTPPTGLFEPSPDDDPEPQADAEPQDDAGAEPQAAADPEPQDAAEPQAGAEPQADAGAEPRDDTDRPAEDPGISPH